MEVIEGDSCSTVDVLCVADQFCKIKVMYTYSRKYVYYDCLILYLVTYWNCFTWEWENIIVMSTIHNRQANC